MRCNQPQLSQLLMGQVVVTFKLQRISADFCSIFRSSKRSASTKDRCFLRFSLSLFNWEIWRRTRCVSSAKKRHIFAVIFKACCSFLADITSPSSTLLQQVNSSAPRLNNLRAVRSLQDGPSHPKVKFCKKSWSFRIESFASLCLSSGGKYLRRVST